MITDKQTMAELGLPNIDLLGCSAPLVQTVERKQTHTV